MTDRFTKAERSSIMARIKSQGTGAEYIVRRLLHREGYRYRLSVRGLPGTPDIVLPRHKKIILVHGCFWHGHQQCGRAARPRSNVEFWNTKLDKNIKRDKKVRKELSSLGWNVLVIWECQLKDEAATEKLLREFMSVSHQANNLLCKFDETLKTKQTAAGRQRR